MNSVLSVSDTLLCDTDNSSPKVEGAIRLPVVSCLTGICLAVEVEWEAAHNLHDGSQCHIGG